MAYEESKLSRVKHLKELAQRIKTGCATKAELKVVSDKVDALVTTGGEPNVITAVKNNGTALPITDKAVDIGTPISTAISGLRTELMGEGVPEAYDTFKELADYIETHQTAADALAAAVGSKVDKVEGMGLSTNSYTDEEKAKLAGIEVATDAEVTEMLNEVFGTPAA